MNFEKKPTKEEIIDRWENFKGLPQELELPSAPKQFIRYMEEDNRPQVKLDIDFENGMGISMGRLREDTMFDYKFVGLSHNTVPVSYTHLDVYKRQLLIQSQPFFLLPCFFVIPSIWMRQQML